MYKGIYPACRLFNLPLPNRLINLFSAKDLSLSADCRASAKLSNLSVHSDMGPCIIHRRGRLTVQNSVLCSHASLALDHLVRPPALLLRPDSCFTACMA